VRVAADAGTRAVRQARLAAIRATFDPLAVDETVVEYYGEVLATARSQRRASKATDLPIIAPQLRPDEFYIRLTVPGRARPLGGSGRPTLTTSARLPGRRPRLLREPTRPARVGNERFKRLGLGLSLGRIRRLRDRGAA
jgi:hypothetical protein